MSSQQQIELLRRRIGAYRDDIRQLEALRRLLLARGARHPRSSVANGLRLNAEAVAAVHYADRLARARLEMLLLLTCGDLGPDASRALDLWSMRN